MKRIVSVIAVILLVLWPHAGSADDKADLASADALAKEVEQLAEQGQFDVAAKKAKSVLELRQHHLPADDPRIGEAMSDLGAVYTMLDDHVHAGPLLKKAVELLERVREGKPEHAVAVSNLAAFHAQRGEQAKALALRGQGLELAERAYGPEHASVALAKRTLALAISGTDFKRAEELLISARTIHDKVGDERGAVVDMIALAMMRKNAGRPRWIELLNEAIARSDAAFRSDDLGKAELARSVGEIWRREAASAGSPEATKRWRAMADSHYDQAEKILTKFYGPAHTKLAELYSQLAFNAEAGQDLDRAVELRTRANDIEEAHLATVLAAESESVKLAYLAKLNDHAQDTVSMHYMTWTRLKRHAGAAKLAMTTVLRRKGRALDATAQNRAALKARMGPGEQRLLGELLDVRAALAAEVIRGPGNKDAGSYKADVERMERRIVELDDQVSAVSASYRVAAAPITVEAVQAAIPEDAVLVEIYRVWPKDVKAFTAGAERDDFDPHYVAYVLRRTGPVMFTHLAEASVIDTQVAQFRRALADPENDRLGDPAGRLYLTTISRVKGFFGDAKHVLISPDGELNLVPFAALLDEDGFLVKRWTFSYLSSGRDLLRYRASVRSATSPATILADPSFDLAGGKASPAGSSRGTLAKAVFTPLPGTREEAGGIGKVLPGARVLLGPDATEAALKQVKSPAILHVATHGFFLDESKGRGGARGLELDVEPPQAPDAPSAPKVKWHIKDRMLLSGIALAGANQRRGGADDDGILTALEASSLDLGATELVALSACETGIGKQQLGEGVFGLRRALVIAGSATQVMSLWKVDDEATRDLMIAYYQKLLAGAGRAAAMRDVQLAMMEKKGTRHPYFWAAFIVSGNPGPLAMASAPGASGEADVPKVEPGARGCGCRTTGNAPGGSIAMLAVAAVLLTRRRRRPGTRD